MTDERVSNVQGVAVRLGVFVQTLEGTTSLALLRRIDETVDALIAQGKAFSGFTRWATMLTEGIATMEVTPGDFIDPDDAIVRDLKAVYDSIENQIPKLLQGKAAIDRDARLNADHCDLLHSAYDDAISASGAIVEAMKDVRAAVIRHDLAAEPRHGGVTYESVKDLVNDLRTMRVS
jgi:hypothetical protein